MFATASIATLTFKGDDFQLWEPVVGIAFLACNAYVLVRTLKSSATVCESGLSYKSLRGTGEMRWEDVEKFRYAVVKTYHQGIIPTTHYTITLVDKAGHRAELGSNVEHPKELAALLWSKLQDPLLKKALAGYDSGTPLDFGAIKVSRENIIVSLGLKKITIPTANVAGCSIDKGCVRIAERMDGKLKHRDAMMGQVDNAFPLLELINRRIVPQVQMQPLAMGASAGR